MRPCVEWAETHSYADRHERVNVHRYRVGVSAADAETAIYLTIRHPRGHGTHDYPAAVKTAAADQGNWWCAALAALVALCESDLYTDAWGEEWSASCVAAARTTLAECASTPADRVRSRGVSANRPTTRLTT